MAALLWETTTLLPSVGHTVGALHSASQRQAPIPQGERMAAATSPHHSPAGHPWLASTGIQRTITVRPSGLRPHPRHSVIISPSPVAACDSLTGGGRKEVAAAWAEVPVYPWLCTACSGPPEAGTMATRVMSDPLSPWKPETVFGSTRQTLLRPKQNTVRNLCTQGSKPWLVPLSWLDSLKIP